jgi:hypothetical protein
MSEYCFNHGKFTTIHVGPANSRIKELANLINIRGKHKSGFRITYDDTYCNCSRRADLEEALLGILKERNLKIKIEWPEFKKLRLRRLPTDMQPWVKERTIFQFTNEDDEKIYCDPQAGGVNRHAGENKQSFIKICSTYGIQAISIGDSRDPEGILEADPVSMEAKFSNFVLDEGEIATFTEMVRRIKDMFEKDLRIVSDKFRSNRNSEIEKIAKGILDESRRIKKMKAICKTITSDGHQTYATVKRGASVALYSYILLSIGLAAWKLKSSLDKIEGVNNSIVYFDLVIEALQVIGLMLAALLSMLKLLIKDPYAIRNLLLLRINIRNQKDFTRSLNTKDDAEANAVLATVANWSTNWVAKYKDCYLYQDRPEGDIYLTSQTTLNELIEAGYTIQADKITLAGRSVMYVTNNFAGGSHFELEPGVSATAGWRIGNKCPYHKLVAMMKNNGLEAVGTADICPDTYHRIKDNVFEASRKCDGARELFSGIPEDVEQRVTIMTQILIILLLTAGKDLSRTSGKCLCNTRVDKTERKQDEPEAELVIGRPGYGDNKEPSTAQTTMPCFVRRARFVSRRRFKLKRERKTLEVKQTYKRTEIKDEYVRGRRIMGKSACYQITKELSLIKFKRFWQPKFTRFKIAKPNVDPAD